VQAVETGKSPASYHRLQARKVLAAYGIGATALAVVIYTPFYLSCLWKMVLGGIPCPACGITRSFVLASQLDLWGAITKNILFLPLLIGALVYFVCALLDAFTGKRAIQGFNALLSNKWIITAAVVLMSASWYYNIVRGI